MIRKLISKYLYRPIYYRVYGGFDYRKYYRFLKDTQWDSLSRNQERQKEMLYGIVKHCIENVPYYKRVARERDITIHRATIEKDLMKFPVLTKDIIRREMQSLVVKHGPKTYDYASGGSTGEPITLVQDFDYKMKMLLQKELQLEWADIRPWDETVMLWGSEVDITKARERPLKRLANWIKSTTILNAFILDDERMRNYVDTINRVRPAFILSYAQSLNDLSNFIIKEKLQVHKPKAIMTSATKLTNAQRSLIESVWGAKVFDRYGTREVGDIGSECDRHAGFHLSMFMHYVEILDKKGKAVKHGEEGELHITLLTNYTMPLLRYRIGDTVIAGKKACPCGRGLPLLRNVVGRETDNFVRPDGTVVPGPRIGYLLGVLTSEGHIDKFQAIQRSPSRIELRVVMKDKAGLNRNKELVEKRIRESICPECVVDWKFVSDIKPTRSGKHRHTIREFR
jgi:phenylacetate-CoA ligase